MKRNAAIADLDNPVQPPLPTPFVFKHGPNLEHTYSDDKGLTWTRLMEFPQYEISSPSIAVRDCINKNVKTVDKEGFVRFYINPTTFPRSLQLLYRKTFQVFDTDDSSPGELWCDCVDLASIIVSNKGRVVNRDTLCEIRRVVKDGYSLAKVKTNSGAWKNERIHILVVKAFIGPPPTPAHTVNHIDSNKSNNQLQNLKWATKSEQTLHAIQMGLFNPGKNKTRQEMVPLKDERWVPISAQDLDESEQDELLVSSLGRVAKCGRLLSSSEDTRGYHRVHLSWKGQGYMRLVHCLVAHAFLPPMDPSQKFEVDHIDNNPSNNALSNLQWLTGRENTLKATGVIIGQYTKEGTLIARFRGTTEAAEKTGYSQPCIARAARGERDLYQGFVWKQLGSIKDIEWGARQ